MLSALLITTLFFQVPGAAAPGSLAQPQPHEGTWQVDTIDNIKVLPDSSVTIQLQGASILGTASCNTYRGAVEIAGTRVKVGELLRTMKACDEPRMSEESDFFSVLGGVVRLELPEDDALVLVTADGRTIRARRK